MDGVEHVGEEDDVRLALHAEAAVDGLEDAAEEVHVVEAGQGDEQQVERVSHVCKGRNRKAFVTVAELTVTDGWIVIVCVRCKCLKGPGRSLDHAYLSKRV